MELGYGHPEWKRYSAAPHLVLAGGVATYLLANLFFVWQAATGVIHPPWGVLWFFTLYGPALMILIAIIVGIAFRGELHVLATIGVILVMLLAGYFNFQLM